MNPGAIPIVKRALAALDTRAAAAVAREACRARSADDVMALLEARLPSSYAPSARP